MIRSLTGEWKQEFKTFDQGRVADCCGRPGRVVNGVGQGELVHIAGNCGSTMKRTGMSRPSPAANFCGLKQKHSVLWKYRAVPVGEMLGTACATDGTSSQILGIERGVVELSRMHAHGGDRGPEFEAADRGGLGHEFDGDFPIRIDRLLRRRLPAFASALPMPAARHSTSYSGTSAQPKRSCRRS
jgi:hypothetical protein